MRPHECYQHYPRVLSGQSKLSCCSQNVPGWAKHATSQKLNPQTDRDLQEFGATYTCIFCGCVLRHAFIEAYKQRNLHLIPSCHQNRSV
jgi:hypothetical protein